MSWMGGARIDLEVRTAILKALRKGARPSVVAQKFAVSRSSIVHIGRRPASFRRYHRRSGCGQRQAVEVIKFKQLGAGDSS